MRPPPKRLRRLPPGGDASGPAKPDPRHPLEWTDSCVAGAVQAFSPAPVWPRGVLLGGTAVAACGALAALLVGAAGQPEGLPPALAALAALALLLGVALAGSLRRFLVFMVFFTAALDMSKAVLAPQGRFYVPGLYLTVAQALLLCWAVLWAAQWLLRERRRLPFTRTDGWAAAFLAVVWLGALRGADTALSLASAVAYSLCVLGFYMASHGLRTAADLRLALRALLAMFGLQAGFVALQMATRAPLVLPGIKVTAGPMTLALGEGGAFRPIGLFNHPNVTADYVVWLLLPALALVLLGRRRLSVAAWWTALAVLLASGAMLLVSLSRGGWAAAVLGMAVLATVYARRGLLRRHHLLVAAAAALGVLALVALLVPQVFLRLSEPDGRSTESRLLLADQALMIIRQQPWLGVGFGNYNRAAFDHIPASWALVSADYHQALLQLVVHNQYLLCAAELGLPALGLWLWLLVRLARQAWPLSQWRDPGRFALATGLAAALVAHLLYLASDNYYVDIRVFMLWLAAGMLQALTLQARHGTAPGVAQ